jgi:hypothetical protein
MRAAFCLLAIFQLATFLASAPLQLSDQGWLSVSESRFLTGGYWSAFYWVSSAVGVKSVLMFGILAAAALAMGLAARASALILFLVLSSVHIRNPLISDADDALFRIVAFYFVLMPPLKAEPVPGWSYRLFQSQLALVYFLSGWAKAGSSPDWLNGKALLLSLLNPVYSRFDVASVVNIPVTYALAIASVLTVVWEISFPALVLTRFRLAALAFGILFHLGSFVFLNLRLFPLLMLVLYVPFIFGHRRYEFRLAEARGSKA